MTFVTYLRLSDSINSDWFPFVMLVFDWLTGFVLIDRDTNLKPGLDRVLANADINGQRQKLLIAGFTMTQIENIFDDEIELMKTKCENSEIDFLFVLDGSGDRNDDSKTSVLRHHNGHIDVGDGFWRPNLLVTSLRYW